MARKDLARNSLLRVEHLHSHLYLPVCGFRVIRQSTGKEIRSQLLSNGQRLDSPQKRYFLLQSSRRRRCGHEGKILIAPEVFGHFNACLSENLPFRTPQRRGELEFHR